MIPVAIVNCNFLAPTALGIATFDQNAVSVFVVPLDPDRPQRAVVRVGDGRPIARFSGLLMRSPGIPPEICAGGRFTLILRTGIAEE
jgi:hypothetical protein